MLDNAPNQLVNFRTKKCVEINDDSRGTYNTNSQIKCKTSMLKSSLYDYSDAYVLVTGDITAVGAGATNTAIQQDKKIEIINKQCLKFLHRLPIA